MSIQEPTPAEKMGPKYLFLVGGTLLEVQYLSSGFEAINYCKAKYPTGYVVMVVQEDANLQKAPDVGIYR